MKFRAEREALADAVASAQRATSSRPGMLPVLSGIKVTLGKGVVELTGSDRELTVRASLSAAVDGEGEAVLPARLLADILARLDADTVTVELAPDEARITAGRFATTLRTMVVSEFPILAPVPEGGVTVDAREFADALRQVIPSAAKDDARLMLTGVLLSEHDGGLRLVTTDTYRLSVRDLPGFTQLVREEHVIVPARALAEVTRVATEGEIEVLLEGRDASFRVGGVTVTTRIIEGDFPPYQNLIPEGYPNRLTVRRDALAAVVGRVKLVGRTRDAAQVRLHMTTDGVEVSAVSQDVGEAHEFVEATFTGEELKVAFNADYLVDGLNAIGGDEITLETTDPQRPAVMRGVGAEDFLYLLMPVRI